MPREPCRWFEGNIMDIPLFGHLVHGVLLKPRGMHHLLKRLALPLAINGLPSSEAVAQHP